MSSSPLIGAPLYGYFGGVRVGLAMRFAQSCRVVCNGWAMSGGGSNFKWWR